MPVCDTEKGTESLAADIAVLLRPGDVIGLRGDLGTGKSCFARGVIRTLAGDNGLAVPSPTFTLLQTYETPAGEVWHFDLYRLRTAEDVYELGWEEALTGKIVLIEWPERLDALAPPFALDVRFASIPGQLEARDIQILPGTAWKGRQAP